MIDHQPKKADGKKIIEKEKIQFVDDPNEQSHWQAQKRKRAAKKMMPSFAQKRLGIASAWKTLTCNCQTQPSKNKSDQLMTVPLEKQKKQK